MTGKYAWYVEGHFHITLTATASYNIKTGHWHHQMVFL